MIETDYLEEARREQMLSWTKVSNPRFGSPAEARAGLVAYVSHVYRFEARGTKLSLLNRRFGSRLRKLGIDLKALIDELFEKGELDIALHGGHTIISDPSYIKALRDIAGEDSEKRQTLTQAFLGRSVAAET